MEIVVSVKRSARKEAPDDWQDQVLSVDGVAARGDPLFGRMTVDVTDTALGELQDRLGRHLHLEPLIKHRLSDDDHEPGP